MEKLVPKYINVTQHPTVIVGERPNTQRIGDPDKGYALLANRTGDFVKEAIQGKDNIILTNVTNYMYSGPFKFGDSSILGVGLCNLKELIKQHPPCQIICLGGIAQIYVRKVTMDYKLIDFPHPSWINRFRSSERQIYIQTLRLYLP